VIAHQDSKEDDRYVDSLAEIMQVKDDHLPAIYMLDPYTLNAVRYPDKLDDMTKVSNEIILAWADVVKIETDLGRLEEDIKEFHEANGKDFEGDARLKEANDQFMSSKEDLETILVLAKKGYEEEKQQIKDGNTFAEQHEDYLDMAELHMARITEVMMDEL